MTSHSSLWAAGWVIKAHDPEFPHSNWNGWMKRIHACDAKQSTQIDFLPVIEGDHNDLNTIFTTLKECIRLSADRVAIVTFDLPIWLKAVDIIKQANLPVIARLRGFHLLTRDWILLQSMSLNPSDYGWTLGVHGYEPVPTLDPMAPELLKFTSCNCHGDCSNRRCSCKKNGVTFISACGVCKGISCKNCSHDVVQSEEDIDNDS